MNRETKIKAKHINKYWIEAMNIIRNFNYEEGKEYIVHFDDDSTFIFDNLNHSESEEVCIFYNDKISKSKDCDIYDIQKVEVKPTIKIPKNFKSWSAVSYD